MGRSLCAQLVGQMGSRGPQPPGTWTCRRGARRWILPRLPEGSREPSPRGRWILPFRARGGRLGRSPPRRGAGKLRDVGPVAGVPGPSFPGGPFQVTAPEEARGGPFDSAGAGPLSTSQVPERRVPAEGPLMTEFLNDRLTRELCVVCACARVYICVCVYTCVYMWVSVCACVCLHYCVYAGVLYVCVSTYVGM